MRIEWLEVRSACEIGRHNLKFNNAVTSSFDLTARLLDTTSSSADLSTELRMEEYVCFDVYYFR